jgi:hypothetical protein
VSSSSINSSRSSNSNSRWCAGAADVQEEEEVGAGPDSDPQPGWHIVTAAASWGRRAVMGRSMWGLYGARGYCEPGG